MNQVISKRMVKTTIRYSACQDAFGVLIACRGQVSEGHTGSEDAVGVAVEVLAVP